MAEGGNAKNPTTVFPDLPRESPLVDAHGMITDDWKFIFDQLFAALHVNFKPEGFVMPQQSSTNISKLTQPQSFANILYNTTVDSFYGNLKVPASGSAKSQVWWPFAMITNYPGNPNGNLAGSLYWFCWDTVNMILYICTTAGNASTAVWTNTDSGLDAFMLL